MKICMVTGDFPPNSGGLGIYVLRLAKMLKSRGHSVVVLTRGGINSFIREIYEGIIIYRVFFIPTYPFHLFPHGIVMNMLLKKIGNDFDVIHLHSPIVPKVKIHKPYILTQHGTAEGFINGLKLIDGFSIVETLFKWHYIGIDKNVAKNAKLVTAVSETCKKELRKYYKINNVIVVKNGVNTHKFSYKRKESYEPRVLYVGQLITKKGIPDLINAFALVLKYYPKAKLILAGDGPLKDYLLRLCRQLKIEESVYFRGYINQRQLINEYQNSWVFVLASYHEGLPNVILEAMSVGLPVIATNIEPHLEIIKNGINGLIFEKNNYVQLSDCIIRLFNNYALRQQISKNARQIVENEFDWEIIANEFERLYQTLKGG